MLTAIINEIFSSTAMKTYLCKHISELYKHDNINIIAEASSISLQRKLELFEKLAESENLDAEIEDSSQIAEYSYKSYADEIRKALDELHSINSSDMFLLNVYERKDNGFECTNSLPFISYEKAVRYIDGSYYDAEDTYYTLGKWHTDSEGNMNETYWYTIANGRVIYFSDDNVKFEVYPNGRLNLPVPFKAGDIVTVHDMPFAENRWGIIIDLGDNKDCCSVQILYVNDDGIIEVNAFKHGHILETKNSMQTSPLYSAEIFSGELTGNDEILLKVHRFMAEKKYTPREYYEILNGYDGKKI